ncbi:hypothetical protein LXL04_015070 [Taraxacum kok-saghyz]
MDDVVKLTMSNLHQRADPANAGNGKKINREYSGPLMRSWDLTKGMKSISTLLFLYYLFVIGFFELLTSIGLNFRDNTLIVVLVVTMLGSFLLMMGLLSNTAANTVLYMYCKDFHGESVLEIADGFDYINLNLTLDDEKVAHVVTVVE